MRKRAAVHRFGVLELVCLLLLAGCAGTVEEVSSSFDAERAAGVERVYVRLDLDVLHPELSETVRSGLDLMLDEAGLEARVERMLLTDLDDSRHEADARAFAADAILSVEAAERSKVEHSSIAVELRRSGDSTPCWEARFTMYKYPFDDGWGSDDAHRLCEAIRNALAEDGLISPAE